MLVLRVLAALEILLGSLLLAPSRPTGVDRSSFFSRSRSQQIRFAIYTPPGYANGTRRYPVLYFLHGSGGTFNMYWHAISTQVPEARGDAGDWLNRLIAGGKIPPLIIVTPDDEAGEWGAENETMVTQELIAYVDANWRTIPQREGRAIEGFSMGGAGANRYASRHPDLYCSTIVMAAPEIEPLAASWEQNKASVIENELAIRLAVGEEDGQLESMASLHEALNSLEIPHQYETAPGVDHDFGALYDAVGLEGLQFHGDCFQQHVVDQPNRVFIPYTPRRYVPLRMRLAPR